MPKGLDEKQAERWVRDHWDELIEPNIQTHRLETCGSDLAGRVDLRIVVAQCLQPPEFDRAHAILPSAYGACRPLVAAACGEHGGA